MNRLALIGWAVLFSLFSALGYLVYSGAQERAVLQAANEALTEAVDHAAERAAEDRKVLVARQGEIASQALKLKKSEQALSKALAANPAWADAPVPANVQDALNAN